MIGLQPVTVKFKAPFGNTVTIVLPTKKAIENHPNGSPLSKLFGDDNLMSLIAKTPCMESYQFAHMISLVQLVFKCFVSYISSIRRFDREEVKNLYIDMLSGFKLDDYSMFTRMAYNICDFYSLHYIDSSHTQDVRQILESFAHDLDSYKDNYIKITYDDSKRVVHKHYI